MPYRVVTQNGINGEVICMGNDENQGGSDYNNLGKWCEFTFEQIPELTEDIKGYLGTDSMLFKFLFKVVDNVVVCKELLELN